MRTFPSVRRALALLLAAVALILGIFILFAPGASVERNALLIAITDILLAIAIILGVVIIRSQYDQ